MQNLLFDIKKQSKFPTTRYQGSKLKYIDWIWNCIQDLNFETVLDAFGGTGSVSYKFKQEGKCISYNDILQFNQIIGSALIENDNEIITEDDLKFILTNNVDLEYPTFITDTFSDIYYTDAENIWLDTTITNIKQLQDKYKQHLAFFALFQACIIKRPYNLFHRKNLYIRQSEVERSFGNKSSWDTPFEIHFRNFVKEANNSVFSNGKKNKSLNSNVFNIPNIYDLVYIDTPYISDKGTGTDYLDFYHFLEGIVNYENWDNLIDYKSKHKRMKVRQSEWANVNQIEGAFERLIQHFKDSILVISYRSDGIPSIPRLSSMLSDYGKDVVLKESSDMKYALSKKQSSEVLLIAV